MGLLWDQNGYRLYLTPSERELFISEARRHPPEWCTFAHTLAFTGCRISEALNLSADQINIADCRVNIETLKRRRKGIVRRVPVPKNYLEDLDKNHKILALQSGDYDGSARVWPVCRTTAYNRIKMIMRSARISGPHANPKGLRHAYAIHAILRDVPITSISKWMGHSKLETTQIYLNALDEEEYSLAERMW